MRANRIHCYVAQVVEFTLDELIGYLVKKKTRKRKRDSGDAVARKEGAIVINRAPAPLESIAEEVPRLPIIELEVKHPDH